MICRLFRPLLKMPCTHILPQLSRPAQRLARPTRRRGEGAQRKIAWPCESNTRLPGRLSTTRQSVARALPSQNELIEPTAIPETTGGQHQGKLPVKGLSFPELVSFCREVLEEEHPEKRARQLWRWMYSDYRWMQSLEDAAAGMCRSSPLGFAAASLDTLTHASRSFSRDYTERVFEGI